MLYVISGAAAEKLRLAVRETLREMLGRDVNLDVPFVFWMPSDRPGVYIDFTVPPESQIATEASKSKG